MSGTRRKSFRKPGCFAGCVDHIRKNRFLPLIDDFGFDSQDRALLDIVRHLSCGFVISAYDGLAKAQQRARLDWAEHDSARIVESVVFLLARMQAARGISFEFITTECPWCSNHICQSELQLMLLLRAGRRNDNPRLEAAAQLVAAAGDPRGLMIAAVALACVIENCECHRGKNASPTLH